HRRRAALDDAFEHMRDLVRGARVEDLLALLLQPRHRLAVPFGHVAAGAGARIGAPDDLAAAVLHVIDHGRIVLDAVVRQRRVGVDHLQDSGLARAERERRIVLVFADADPLERARDVLHARVHCDMHGHEVARLLEPPAHRVLAAPAAAEVAEAFLAEVRALVVAKCLVGDHRRRGHALVETGGVDEGLDGRSGLSLRLRRAIEVAQAEVEAPLHRQYAARIRVLRHEAALDLGHGANGPDIAVGRGGRDVADLDGIGQSREREFLAVREADRRRPAAPRRDDADTPVAVVYADVARGELLGEVAVVGIDRRDRSVPRTPAAETHQAVAQRLLRGALHLGVERRADPEAAGIDAVRTVFRLLAVTLDKLAADFLEEIAGIGRARLWLLLDEAERQRLG